jgi:hypothetical protein
MVSHRRKINCILSASCLLSSIFSLYILLLCFCRVDCYARDTLKQGDWITDNGTALVSSGGTFKLGFFTSNHKRFVGIWYKQDQQTVVWVSNRDSPVVNATGTFGIADDGNFKISDTTGKEYWSTDKSSSTNRTLKLMDSGNLVLSDDDDQLATSLWESFRRPTHTFLPGMKMDENLMLTSWIGDGDPGIGEFTFKQYEEEGGHYVISKQTGDYWRSWMSGKFSSTDELMPYAIAYLLSNFSKSLNQTKYPLPPKSSAQLLLDYNYTRLVMNYNGELQYLKWYADKGNWSMIWREPEDNCSIYNACGKFGSCNINNRLKCKCLPGFQPTNPANWDSGDFLGGCTRNSTSFDNSDMFLNLKMMKVNNPDSRIYDANNETECRMQCLNSSLCQAYSLTDICWIWTENLSNLQEEYTNGGRKLSVRVAKSVIGTPFTHWNIYAWINSIAELNP